VLATADGTTQRCCITSVALYTKLDEECDKQAMASVLGQLLTARGDGECVVMKCF